ncbi:MAG: phosphoribulokinase [Rubrobacter sp.]|nr:phosphoribulokinase [Rubrobacter sp.]
MPRPIMIGLVGDSATGKTTFTNGLVGALGEEQVTVIGTDDYHKYDREQRKTVGVTPLNPEGNYIDIMGYHFQDLLANRAILKPIYEHSDGTFAPPEYIEPKRFMIFEGLLAYHTQEMRDAFDVRVYLDPPEELRREWKISRDTGKRGYEEDEVHEQFNAREPDSEAYIRPQKHHADLVVSFRRPSEDRDQSSLDAVITMRPGLPHPDLSGIIGEGSDGLELRQENDHEVLSVPGDLDRERAKEIEEHLWEKLHFARHLDIEHLGVLGDDGERSESLAIIQLLILYHALTARASVAVGGAGTRE